MSSVRPGFTIKNPLTVIAIFAGLAEVFGVLVLPHLTVCVQFIFVWFVMLFPCLLVALFFYVLWNKHGVLYAPSDFSDENHFKELLIPATPVEVDKNLNTSVEELLSSPADEAETQFVAPGGISAPDLVTPEAHARVPGSASEALLIRSRAAFAESYAVKIMSKEKGLSFHAQMKLRNKRDIYDAAYIDSDSACLLEVHYLRRLNVRTMGLSKTFDKAERFFSSLNPAQAENFEFVYVIAAEEYAVGSLSLILHREVLRCASSYSFRTTVREITLPSENLT